MQEVFFRACKFGDKRVVKELLQFFKRKEIVMQALEICVKHCEVEIFKFLLRDPRFKVVSKESAALLRSIYDKESSYDTRNEFCDALIISPGFDFKEVFGLIGKEESRRWILTNHPYFIRS